MTKKKKIIYISVGFILLLVMAYLLLVAEDKKKYTKENFIEPESVQSIQEGVVSSKKMYDFILSKIQNPEAFLKIHLEGKHVSVSVRQKATMEMFYAAIKQQEIDYLTASLDIDSLQSLWGTTMDFQVREQVLLDVMSKINQDGKLMPISYQLEKGDYGIEEKKGILILSYEGGNKIKVPFIFIDNGDEDHSEFLMSVELQAIVNELETIIKH